MSGNTNGTANNTQQGGMTGAAGAGGTQVPAWLKGLQAGQQIAQLGQQSQMRPQMPMQRPGGQVGGMPQGGVVPGAQGAAPPMPSGAPGMATAGQGMPQGGGQQLSPQMLQMLMQMRGGQGGGGLMS